MALSEHEQNLLDEMERNLYRNEADVVSATGFKSAPNYTAIAGGVLLGLAGLVTMIVGVTLDLTLVGVIGFVLLFFGVMVAVAMPGREGKKSLGASAVQDKPAGPKRVSFMDRVNERWENRDPRADS